MRPFKTVCPMPYFQVLCRKGTATAASLSGVGVGKLEAAADHGVAEVEYQTVEIEDAFAIAHYLKAFVIEHFIV